MRQGARERQKNIERKDEGKETSFSRGRKKTHNTGGVKFQQALVAQNHIPAKGMCGQGV